MEKPTKSEYYDEDDQTQTFADLAASTNTGLFPGLILGDTLRLERLLGKGGMGEVWLATHLLLNELRAVKVILTTLALNYQARQRFIYSEARNALKLSHPNIVRTYDLNQLGEIPYIVMEYVSGSDLKAKLKTQGSFTPEAAGELLMQIATAINAAHSQGLVHRDLKPSNILITDTGIAKISDFGLVKDLTLKQSDLSSTGYGMGTPLYMAPEQALGRASIASDIYALGVILYEMLTGELPFSGSAEALLIQHATTLPTPPNQLNPAIPKAINEVILQALAKNLAERPVSALALASAYQKILSDQKTMIEPITFTEDLRPEKDSSVPLASATNNQDFSPLNILDVIPNNLPLGLNVFIGRKTELKEISTLLLDKRVRLLTLTGVGGTGKTRLSLEVAQTVSTNFPDGVYFLALENVIDTTTLIGEIATTIGVKEMTNMTLLEQLKSYLADKQMLLLLDNFEQLVEKGAGLLTELLKTAPKLKFLVTTREILNLSVEREYQVEPLALPQVGEANHTIQNLLEYSAIALFNERAKTVKSNFTLTEENAEIVVEICRRLDGLPLAIELAATKVRTLSLANLLLGLNNKLKILIGGYRDLPPRQQTLRAAIDWSYDLLEPAQQILFSRLAIFRGGYTLDSVEAVCNAENDLEISVLEGLETLINKSLLKRSETTGGETRFNMLPTIHEYGLEMLTSETRATLSARHATYFIELAEELDPKLRSVEGVKHLGTLDNEYDNIKAALEWMINRGESEKALRLAASMGEYWRMQCYLSEGHSYLTRTLELSDKPTTKYRARALHTLGKLVYSLGDIDRARFLYKEALDLYRDFGDEVWLARALTNLGSIITFYEDVAKGRPLLEEALSIFRKLEDKQGISMILDTLGGIATERGEFDTAQSQFVESLAIKREIGDKSGIADILNALGWLAYYRGDYAHTRVLVEETLAISRQIGAKHRTAEGLELLALSVKDAEGDYDKAQSLLEEALAIKRHINSKEGVASSLGDLGEILYCKGDYTQAKSIFEESFAISREMDYKRLLPFTLKNLGLLAYIQGDFTKARSLLEEALAIFQKATQKKLITQTLKNLGWLVLQQEDYALGQKFSEESLIIAQEIGSRPRIAEALTNLGWLAFVQGDNTTAQWYFNDCYQLYLEMGQKQGIAVAENNLGLIRLQQGNYTEARKYFAESLKTSYRKSFKLELLTAFIGLTEMQAIYLGNYPLAARFAGIAEALRQTMGIPLEPLIAKIYNSAVTSAKVNLGQEVYATIFSEGKAMSLAEAVEYALQTLTTNSAN